jgi:hypothetical protein
VVACTTSELTICVAPVQNIDSQTIAQLELARLLVAKGARTADGGTPVQVAVKAGWVPLLQACMSEKALAGGLQQARSSVPTGSRKLLRVLRALSPGIPCQTDLQGGMGGAQLEDSSSSHAGMQGGTGGDACLEGSCSPQLDRSELPPPAKRPRVPGTGGLHVMLAITWE